MGTVLRNRRLSAGVALVGAWLATGATGCLGSEAHLLVAFETLDGDAPWQNVARLEILFWQDDDVIATNEPVPSENLSLPVVERVAPVFLEASGYDSKDRLISRGQSTPELPDRGDDCCVVLCFCSVVAFDGHLCDCGNDECNQICAP